MSSILVHITHGPEAPNRVALGLLVARTAAAEGHEVSVFLASDGVNVIRDEVLDSLHGIGLGHAREHVDNILSSGGKFWVSKMSSKARGVTESDLEGKSAQMATPSDLVRLSLEHDRMFTY
ncbi:MAG TPA: DsrE family protein [Actinomycetota bacterium]|nr:DsrE family protein [Actinomycetota bacterium]